MGQKNKGGTWCPVFAQSSESVVRGMKAPALIRATVKQNPPASITRPGDFGYEAV